MKNTPTQYAKSLHELTAGKTKHEIDKVVSAFFDVLMKNGQVKLVSKIIQKFNEIWNENEGIVEAEVISAYELEKGELHKIEKYIEGKYKAKKVVLNNKIDEKIKGGIIIKVKDEILDGSISAQLRNLQNKLRQ